MSQAPAIFDDSLSTLYRRRARRLRATFSQRPDRLQQSLQQLSHQVDQLAGQDLTQALDGPRGPHAAFAALVNDTLDGPVLRYSNRQRLLKQAKGLGIGRFEANLIIALIQHRRGYTPDQPGAYPTPRPRWVVPLATYLLVQAAIAAMVYWLFL